MLFNLLFRSIQRRRRHRETVIKSTGGVDVIIVRERKDDCAQGHVVS